MCVRVAKARTKKGAKLKGGFIDSVLRPLPQFHGGGNFRGTLPT